MMPANAAARTPERPAIGAIGRLRAGKGAAPGRVRRRDLGSALSMRLGQPEAELGDSRSIGAAITRLLSASAQI
jgi:hypothetical protein